MKKEYLVLAAAVCLLSACSNNSDNGEVTLTLPSEPEIIEFTDSSLSELFTEETSSITEQTTEETTSAETSHTEETSEIILSEETIIQETTSSVISETVTTVETTSASVTEAAPETAAPVITSAEETTSLQVTTATESEPPADEQKPSILVAYFSTPEITDASTTASRVTVDGQIYGTTEYMAMIIHENTNSDLFRIELEDPYGGDVPDRALNEQENGILPALSSHIDNLEQYDTIFVGYPTWWYDMPQVMYSFFDEYDFSGKRIIPFNSHGGSQFSGSVERIAELEPDADVSFDGLTISRGDVDSSEETIIQWLNQLDISKK